MKKPNSLRAWLTEALPELARDPEALTIYVTDGSVAGRYGGNLGFEMRYTLHCVLLNYRGAPEQIFLPLMLWLHANQPDLILNHERGVQDIAFNVDVLDNEAVDVEIRLPLAEAVDVLPQEDGSYRMCVREETVPEDLIPLTVPAALLRQLWAPGGLHSEFLVGHPDPAPDNPDNSDVI